MAKKSKLSTEQIKEFLVDREEGGQTLAWCAAKYGLSIGRMSQIQKKYQGDKQMELQLEVFNNERPYAVRAADGIEV